MREITAKYDGTCADCGDPIEAGDRILWDPGAAFKDSAYHPDCDPRPAPSEGFDEDDFDDLGAGVAKALDEADKATPPEVRGRCTCGHERTFHGGPIGGPCSECDCPRFTWTPESKETLPGLRKEIRGLQMQLRFERRGRKQDQEQYKALQKRLDDEREARRRETDELRQGLRVAQAQLDDDSVRWFAERVMEVRGLDDPDQDGGTLYLSDIARELTEGEIHWSWFRPGGGHVEETADDLLGYSEAGVESQVGEALDLLGEVSPRTVKQGEHLQRVGSILRDLAKRALGAD